MRLVSVCGASAGDRWPVSLLSAFCICLALSVGSVGRQREGVRRGGPGVTVPAEGAGVYGERRLQPAEGGTGYCNGIG